MIPTKLLVCTDFSDNSLEARLTAIAYAKVFRAELLILHVVNSRLTGYPTLADKMPLEISALQKEIEQGVTQELELITNDVRRDLEPVSGHSAIGDPSEEIVRFAAEQGVDMIVIGTHGTGGVRRLLLGSTAENVVRTATCPVLVVRSSGQ